MRNLIDKKYCNSMNISRGIFAKGTVPVGLVVSIGISFRRH